MRALAFGVLVVTLPATLLGCAVDATSPVSDVNRADVQHEVGTSSGASNPPEENEAQQQGPLRTVQSHKTATVSGIDTGQPAGPQPEPWRGGDHSGSGGGSKGAQKKDGDLHTKMRDPIKLDDGKDP